VSHGSRPYFKSPVDTPGQLHSNFFLNSAENTAVPICNKNIAMGKVSLLDVAPTQGPAADPTNNNSTMLGAGDHGAAAGRFNILTNPDQVSIGSFDKSFFR
jgi:hypothetical protein